MSDPLALVPAPCRMFRWTALMLAICLSLIAAGCHSEEASLEAIYKSASPGAGRATAAADLRKAFYAKEITANGAINLAHERLDKVGDAKSVAFAAAVLDFLEVAEPDIDKQVLNEFFWIRVGTLAGNAAAGARKAGDLETARSVVLAGPKRWQTDVYWRQCPGHDALASILLFESGEGAEALTRLRDRPDLADEVQQAKDMIEREMKKGRGKKP